MLSRMSSRCLVVCQVQLGCCWCLQNSHLWCYQYFLMYYLHIYSCSLIFLNRQLSLGCFPFRAVCTWEICQDIEVDGAPIRSQGLWDNKGYKFVVTWNVLPNKGWLHVPEILQQEGGRWRCNQWNIHQQQQCSVSKWTLAKFDLQHSFRVYELINTLVFLIVILVLFVRSLWSNCYLLTRRRLFFFDNESWILLSSLSVIVLNVCWSFW